MEEIQLQKLHKQAIREVCTALTFDEDTEISLLCTKISKQFADSQTEKLKLRIQNLERDLKASESIANQLSKYIDDLNSKLKEYEDFNDAATIPCAEYKCKCDDSSEVHTINGKQVCASCNKPIN